MRKEKPVVNIKGGQETTYARLAPIAKEINHRLEAANTEEGKARDHRLAAALRLAEAKETCREVRINFRKWCETEIKTHKYETIRKLTRVGGAKNPELAIEDLRFRTKESNRKLRQKKKAELPENRLEPVITTMESRPQPEVTPEEHAREVLITLGDKVSLDIIRAHARKIGMAVVSENDAHDIRKAQDIVAQQKRRKKPTPVDEMRAAFAALAATAQMDFVRWAAAEIGFTVNSDLIDGTGEDGLDIPKELDRRSAA